MKKKEYMKPTAQVVTRGDSPPVRLKPNQNQELKVPVPPDAEAGSVDDGLPIK